MASLLLAALRDATLLAHWAVAGCLLLQLLDLCCLSPVAMQHPDVIALLFVFAMCDVFEVTTNLCFSWNARSTSSSSLVAFLGAFNGFFLPPSRFVGIARVLCVCTKRRKSVALANSPNSANHRMLCPALLGGAVVLLLLLLLLWLLVQLYATIASWVRRPCNIAARYGPGRAALVTGASSGIGLEVVRRLVAQRVPVCAVCLPNAAADALEAELETASQCMVVRADLSEPQGVERVLSETRDLDVGFAVLCAGGGYARELEHVGSDPQWIERYLHTNVTQTLVLATALYSRWVAAGRAGGLVLMSSAMALMPASHSELYCASKAALASFAASLAPAARAHRIDVHALSPGAVLGTRFFDSVPRHVSVLRPVLALGQPVTAAVDSLMRVVGTPFAAVVDTGAVGVAARLAHQLLGANVLAAAAYAFVWGLNSLFGWFADYVVLPQQAQ